MAASCSHGHEIVADGGCADSFSESFGHASCRTCCGGRTVDEAATTVVVVDGACDRKRRRNQQRDDDGNNSGKGLHLFLNAK